VLTFDDSDGTAQSLLKELTKKYPDDTFVFANGGDRDYNNTPEHDTPGVIFAYGVGGSEKTNSSSQLLEDWSLPKVERPWGYYRVLKNMTGSKVKELVINPGKSLSMQRHRLRSEHWHVVENQCNVELERKRIKTLVIHNQLKVEVGKWHRLYNPYENPCKLIEIQYGELCDEADIERK
jgi:mannose-6-phosphate isomerase-like protein (cupin superfamily)